MEGKFRNINVPPEFEKEVSIFVEKLHEAAGDKNGFEKEDVELLCPDAKHLGPGEVIVPVLSMTGVVVTWISKAWFDKYVLPVIMERLKTSGTEFEKWFRKTLGVKK
jgi:hypothetical protein